MKKLYTLLAFAFTILVSHAQIVNIPDANFKTKLLTLGVDTNNDGNIQLNEALAKTNLSLSSSNISDLTGIGSFSNLTSLGIRNNQISDLSPLDGLNNLIDLDMFGNQVTSFTGLTSLASLKVLDCSFNQLTSVAGIESMPNLEQLTLKNNTYISLANLPVLTHLKYLSCENCYLGSLAEITSMSSLEGLWCGFNSQQILVNVNSMTQLKRLSFRGASLTSLNVIPNLVNLEYLDVGNNQLYSVNMSYFPNLETFVCDNNNLTSLDLSTSSSLTQLVCYENNLATLNLTTCPNLGALNCSYNNLSTLNLTGLDQLYILNCAYNHLTVLDVSTAPSITQLDCKANNLATIDVSNLHNLSMLWCEFSPNLISIFAKNGTSNDGIGIISCPNLEYICADDNQVDELQSIASNNGSSNCHVNSFCSFTPGGTFYTVQGNCRYDASNNGCNSNDINTPNVKLSFTKYGVTGTLIDPDGDYYYDVSAGPYTITAALENPTYFSISPVSSSVNFPSATSPFIRDFCITPNGTHNDLEVTVLLIGPARPGFDATYKVIYKNKGTQAQSGSINFSYDDNIMDLISTNPATLSQGTNILTWSFTNLLPFETREIEVTFNVNSPTETPAVNGGDVLNYTATIIGLTDETPNDNSSTLNQTVVNSYDPNDKTCIEGTSITPSMVGQYVHYVIRFENTGTFPAQNIVVSDIIDTTKFDLSSLVPQSSDHSFITRINNASGKVEFIFENINLPIDDANNDGYVAFKIKTKPTLVAGNTFSNSANIYFDYNFPITTNTYVTTVQALGNQDFEFKSVFSLSPVPTKDILTITTKETVIMTSVSIYNTLGQLVQVTTNPSETIDVLGLQSGSYFIKIVSDRGSATGKFIKE